jgi:Domain of unknown function (DUF1877)
MSCLGIHFALTPEEALALEAFDDEQDRLAFVQEDLEERYLEEPKTYAAESDKAWDAMHRALSDGQLSWDGGEFPFNHAVLGGKPLYSDGDYIMSLKTPEQVQAVSLALAALTESDFRDRYNRIDARSYDGELGDDDFEYTWSWFQEVRDLYRRAAAQGRFVLFTADQ